MSDGVHANMSAFARRKATTALSYLRGRLPPMTTVAPVPSALSDTFFVAVLPSENNFFFFMGAVAGATSSSFF